VIQQGRVDLQHGQADERWVKLVGRRVWLAMALAVPSRRWRGGVSSPHRDRPLITTLVQLLRTGGRCLARLGCVDGLASSGTAFRRVLRPRLVLQAGLLLGHVVKQEVPRRVAGVARRGGPDGCGHGHGAGRHPQRHGEQHRGHRAAQRHLPRRPVALGAPGAGAGPHRGGADRRHVVGWLYLYLRLVAAESPAACACRGALEGAGAPACKGRRADDPPLDEARHEVRPRAAASVGGTEGPGPSTQARAATSYRAGSLTTVN
jgi:hypothetical protein